MDHAVNATITDCHKWQLPSQDFQRVKWMVRLSFSISLSQSLSQLQPSSVRLCLYGWMHHLMVMIIRFLLLLRHLSPFHSYGVKRCSNLLRFHSCTRRTLFWMSQWRSFPPFLLSLGPPHHNYGRFRRLSRVLTSHMFCHSRLSCKHQWANHSNALRVRLITGLTCSRMPLALTSWLMTLILAVGSCGVALQMPLIHHCWVTFSSSRLFRPSLRTHLYLLCLDVQLGCILEAGRTMCLTRSRSKLC
jgi:hypothetical protein